MKRRLFVGTLAVSALAGLDVLPTHSRATFSATSKRRLILVELAGANDGFNTLVPFDNDHYHRLRPSLGLDITDVLPLSGAQGMNQALRPLMPLWEHGSLAWIQGLGYPQPNRSHFQSIALWEKANDGRSTPRRHGWMTHAVEHRLARTVLDPHGISFAGDLSVFSSDGGRWLSVTSARQLYDESLSEPLSDTPEHPTLKLLQDRLKILNSTLRRLRDRVANAPELPAFDGGGFGEQLRQVATLIAAGIDTPVYRVRLGGFDTHENQRQRHARLLGSLGAGLNSFVRQMQALSEWNNTLIMTYSEFGRRAAENRSGGTDHGTAAPHLVLGGDINGGLYGAAPDLAELIDGDPEFTMDYRALYQRILVDGLGAENHSDTLSGYADKRLDGLLGSA